MGSVRAGCLQRTLMAGDLCTRASDEWLVQSYNDGPHESGRQQGPVAGTSIEWGKSVGVIVERKEY